MTLPAPTTLPSRKNAPGAPKAPRRAFVEEVGRTGVIGCTYRFEPPTPNDALKKSVGLGAAAQKALGVSCAVRNIDGVAWLYVTKMSEPA